MKPLRAALIALMCMSGGCATLTSASQNPVSQPKNKVSDPARTVSDPNGQPAKPVKKKKDKKDKDAVKPSRNYDEPENEEDVPCHRISLEDPGACVEV